MHEDRIGWRGRSGVALLVVALAAGACSSATEVGGRPTGGVPIVTDGAPSARCAWPVRADKATLNIAYPDTSATYWALTYALSPGERLVLRGEFPAARYASYISYGPTGGAIAALSDRDIEADAGQANPFRGGATRTSGDRARYTIDVGPTGAVAPATNHLDAGDGKGATGTSVGGTMPGSTVAASAAGPLGGAGPDAVRGTLLYRVYLPDDPADPAGGAALPRVSVVGPSGEVEVQVCKAPGPSAEAMKLVEAFGPLTDRPVPSEPIFIRPDAAAANLFPNPDNVYVATITRYQPGRVVVIRAKAPTYPDTGAGNPVRGDEQVRYWSFCTNEYKKPYPVTACAADHQTALDPEGWFTYVVSTPADRPSNATAANGATWLDWGSTGVDSLLLFRHMMARPDFAESAVRVAQGSLAVSTMGDYAPRGKYCERATFEASGAKGCGL